MPRLPKGPTEPYGDSEKPSREKIIEWQRKLPRRPIETDAPKKSIGQAKVVNEEFQGKVTSYGQQLQYELKLRGWKSEQLAEKIGVPVSKVQKWETNSSAIEFASRQKLAQLLGNDYYLSSEVKATLDGMALQVRIVQILLSAQDFTTVISTLTEFHTQFYLIQQGRFADLAEYTQTQDSRFVEEANLVIDNLTSNSPVLLTLLTDPGTATTAVTIVVTLAVALQKAVDAIAYSWKKIQDIDQEHQKNKIENEKRKLEIEKMRKEWEQQQLEEQVTRKQKEVESTITMMVQIANTLHPDVDEQTREIIRQAMTPGCWKLLDREVALSDSQNS